WLTEVRIERAKDLLMRSIMPLDDIAAHCGFANTPYFCTVFRAMTGTAPGRYRRAHADADPTARTLARPIATAPKRSQVRRR
nr:helix-turn-helix transcriptional regulator [Planctomycetota bacterium]